MKNSCYLLLSFCFALLFMSCNDNITIIQKPINFDEQRKSLSLDYLKDHYGIEKEEPTIDPKIIVVHWTAIPTFDDSFKAFDPPTLPEYRGDIQSGGNLNVSAHFLVDRDGTIFQLLPETMFARHVIGLNYCAIGIENVADGQEFPLTQAQFAANVKLIDYLTDKYAIEYLIGHDQYKNFIGHPMWKEKDPNYLTDKIDVGPDFINRLFANIHDKSLKKAPQTH